jgi:hypothetical protein
MLELTRQYRNPAPKVPIDLILRVQRILEFPHLANRTQIRRDSIAPVALVTTQDMHTWTSSVEMII